MPRAQPTTLNNIFAGSYSRRDTLDLFLADGTVKHLSKGAVTRGANVYQDYIRSVGDFVRTDKEVDRLTITCQNINSELGLLAASDLRLLDYAVADYGVIYQSNTNPALIEDVPQMFRAVISDTTLSETQTIFTLNTDLESLGNAVASRGLKEKCPWAYKSGRECTSFSSELTCAKTRSACRKRFNEFQSGDWEFFEEPTDSAPGSAGNSGGFDGCFALDTPVRLVSDTVAIGSLPLGKVSIPVYSFDPQTGRVQKDEITEVWEYKRKGYFTINFDNGKTLNVSGEHPFFIDLNRFCAVENFTLSQTVKTCQRTTWKSARIVSMQRHADKEIIVRNFNVANNHTYFADGFAVHNVKSSGDIGSYDPYQN